jgi:hypothetical protein
MGVGYFSLSAATLVAGQEGVDLRVWHENGWVAYCDFLDKEGTWRFGRHVLGSRELNPIYVLLESSFNSVKWVCGDEDGYGNRRRLCCLACLG